MEKIGSLRGVAVGSIKVIQHRGESTEMLISGEQRSFSVGRQKLKRHPLSLDRLVWPSEVVKHHALIDQGFAAAGPIADPVKDPGGAFGEFERLAVVASIRQDVSKPL